MYSTSPSRPQKTLTPPVRKLGSTIWPIANDRRSCKAKIVSHCRPADKIAGSMAGQRQQHPRTASASTSAWEDDAWKIDSDDEDFVKASRRSGAGTSSSTAIARLNMLADSDRSGGSASNTNNLSASTAVPSSGTPLRRAPPARPHPYSTSLHESVAEDRTSSTGSSGGLTKTQPDTRASTSSSHVPGGNWLMVERSGSTASAQAVAPAAGLLDTQDGGRSIADSAVDDEEATLQAAKAKREARSKEMLAAIQDDLDQVLNGEWHRINT